jgi:hypothetical protein
MKAKSIILWSFILILVGMVGGYLLQTVMDASPNLWFALTPLLGLIVGVVLGDISAASFLALLAGTFIGHLIVLAQEDKSGLGTTLFVIVGLFVLALLLALGLAIGNLIRKGLIHKN